jgi:hypothetical protein
MNNEPIAWIDPKELDMTVSTSVTKHKQFDTDIPLYIHPAKELGYNDIMGTWWETMPNAKSCEGVFEFARAILRKAQEK